MPGRRANVFWKQLGDTINNDHNIMLITKQIVMNKDHDAENKMPLSLLKKVVETMGVTSVLEINIEFLFNRLLIQSIRIDNIHAFWESVGFTINNDPHLISLIQKHPSLMTNTKHGNKTILERLVDELGMKELISGDKTLQIDYLLHVLQHEDNRIGDANLFWQGIGFTVADDPQMISLIKNHPLLTAKTEHQGKAVLERLIDELGFKELISDDHSLQIDWLLCRLRSEKNCIENKNLFWQRIGFTVADDPQMISLIKTHPLLVETTQYKKLTVVRRFIEELEMYCFAEEYWNHFSRFTDNLYITHSGTIALNDMSDDDSGIPLFMFTTNTNSSEDEYCFDDT
eukprot:95314_1